MFLKSEKHTDEAELPDQQIWGRLLHGDAEALELIFRRYYGQLFDYGMKLVKDRPAVKDALQDLFLTLWNKRAQLSEVQSVHSYLLLSLRRRLLRLKKKSQNRMERNRDYSDDIFDVSINKEDLIILNEIRQERKDQLYRAVEELSARQREVLFLRYYHGLTSPEIAEVLDISSQSVRNNLSRTLGTLKAYLLPASGQ